MRRPLIASLLLAAVAVLATAAFLHALAPGRADADSNPPPPQTTPGRPGAEGGPPPGGPGGPGGPPGGPGGMPFDTSMARADQQVQEMIEHLGPKADMPAESVYKNIQLLKGQPAKMLPRVMVYAFSRGLGVRCGECHVRGDFASDDKGNKKTARAMWKMVDDINHTYLANMKDLDDELPTVNCWTCHRGHSKPETVNR